MRSFICKDNFFFAFVGAVMRSFICTVASSAVSSSMFSTSVTVGSRKRFRLAARRPRVVGVGRVGGVNIFTVPGTVRKKNLRHWKKLVLEKTCGRAAKPFFW
jgi:hypothetical protein